MSRFFSAGGKVFGFVSCWSGLQWTMLAAMLLLSVARAGSSTNDAVEAIDEPQLITETRSIYELLNRLNTIRLEPYSPAAAASVLGTMDELRRRRSDSRLTTDREVSVLATAIGTALVLEKRAPSRNIALAAQWRTELRAMALESDQFTRSAAIVGLGADDMPGNAAIIVAASSMSKGNYVRAGINVLTNMCSLDAEPALLELVNGSHGQVMQGFAVEALKVRKDLHQRFQFACRAETKGG